MPGMIKAKKGNRSSNPFQKISQALDKANVRSSSSSRKLKTNLGTDTTEAQQRRKKRLAAFARKRLGKK